jgi:hypothetical protein
LNGLASHGDEAVHIWDRVSKFVEQLPEVRPGLRFGRLRPELVGESGAVLRRVTQREKADEALHPGRAERADPLTVHNELARAEKSDTEAGR